MLSNTFPIFYAAGNLITVFRYFCTVIQPTRPYPISLRPILKLCHPLCLGLPSRLFLQVTCLLKPCIHSSPPSHMPHASSVSSSVIQNQSSIWSAIRSTKFLTLCRRLPPVPCQFPTPPTGPNIHLSGLFSNTFRLFLPRSETPSFRPT